MATNLEKIKKQILSIDNLPTLPTVAMEVMSLTRNPDSAMLDIVKVIQNDPAITAKILKIANSAFYGMRQRIDTINRALVVLGMNEISNLITSISVFKTFPMVTDKPSFDRKKFWKHCALTGEIAKTISIKLGMKSMSEIFTAGLLHDIGKIILDQYFHENFIESMDYSYLNKVPLFEAEKKTFGVTHAQIGGWIAERWKLPRNLIDAILYHHKPARSLNHKVVTAIVAIANQFSKVADTAFSGEDIEIVFEDTVAWKILQKEAPSVAKIDIAKFTFELEEMIVNADEFINNVS